jgi:tRNA-splicing ligase RtcB
VTPTPINVDNATARHAWTWLPEDRIEPAALAQVRNIASLPTAVAVAVMPDAHVGYGMPIGTVLATSNAVVPYAVGVDIGCGMVASKTNIPAADARDRVRGALMEIYRRVPVGQPTRHDRGQGSHASRQDSEVLREWQEAAAAADAKTKEIRERADRQLGTLGGGNHFIEIQSDGDRIWLMFHTGSRSFGKQLCDRHHATALAWCERYRTPLPDKELAFLAWDVAEGRAYYADMRFAMRYAEESRARIERACLEAMTEAFGPFDVVERIETHHNFAAVERHFGQEVVVHRKGAVRTTDERGAPSLVTIPGSMETGSYIGRGKPSVLALDTCAHGAGRKLGRGAVRREHAGVDIAAEMAAAGIVLVCPPGSDALDEAGRAYKDIEEVMSRQRDLVEPVVRLAPLGVVKG